MSDDRPSISTEELTDVELREVLQVLLWMLDIKIVQNEEKTRGEPFALNLVKEY